MPPRNDLKRGLASGVAHGLIRSYQLTLSGLVGRQCRYLPTCSDYADEAIARHGLWRGGRLALGRLCRCHPWGRSGYDPVPDDVVGERRFDTGQDRASSSAERP